jgi:hypothetical protein
VAQNENETYHIITANEGNAIGLATGYHLATGNVSLVYLQVTAGQKSEFFSLTFFKIFHDWCLELLTASEVNVLYVQISVSKSNAGFTK